jgi:outer-membrane receptor for ferric coprogen and ferric-rhodotorulic acid
MTVTQFLPRLHPIASAAHAALVGMTFAAGTGAVVQSARAESEPGAESSKKKYRIPAGPLVPALSRFAAETAVLLSFDPALTQGKTTSGLAGNYGIAEALATLLAGSGLEAVKSGPGYTLQALPLASPPAGTSPARREEDTAADEELLILPTITVTASPTTDEGFKAETQTTATKMPLSIRETPQSISIITQDSLEARQVTDLGQALETAAGVIQTSGTGPFAGFSPFGFDKITVRGVALDGFFDVREDGFISPTFFSKPDVAIFERIEVVKGPASVLYGRGSAGGFVNRVRKKPLPEFYAELAPSVGSFDFYRLEGDVTGPLFKSERMRGRLVAAYQDANAFVDGVESERTVLAPSLELDVTDSTRLLLHGTYQEDQFIPNPGFPLQQDGNIFKAPKILRSLFVGVPNTDENE